MKFPYRLIKTRKLESLRADYLKILESNAAATDFIKEIENGNLNASFSQTLEGNEGLAIALMAMQQQLQKIAEDEKERKWATEGLAFFADLLRSDHDNSGVFYQKLISNLVKYLNVNQGGLFLIEDEDSDNVIIELVSCYAYNRQKFLKKQIKPGEGLIGQCYLEKETIFMTDIPQDYVSITSGLGTANPACLVVVPLKVNEQVYGFVELASFKPLKPYQIEFLEKLAESTASSISGIKMNMRTRLLLADSQQQAEEMKAQEEEMRQNMEELAATQEDMHRVLKEVQDNEHFITDLMDTLSDSILTVDRNLRLINFNAAYKKTYLQMGIQVEKGFDVLSTFVTKEDKAKYTDAYRRVFDGETVKLTDELHNEFVDMYFETTFSPIRDLKGEIIAAAVYVKDLTQMAKAMKEAKERAAQMEAQEEEMRRHLQEQVAAEQKVNNLLKEVQEREAFMSSLINATRDSIMTIDRNYKVISCNAAMSESLKQSGMVAEKGTDIFTFLQPEQKEKFKSQYDRALGGEAFTLLENFTMGEYELYHEITYSPLMGPGGAILGAALFTKDVTESVLAKRKAEALLQESQEQARELKEQEELLRQNMEALKGIQEDLQRMFKEVQQQEQHFSELINGSHEAILSIDTNYRIMSYNQAYSAVFAGRGVSIDKGVDLLSVLPPAIRKEKKAVFDRALAGELVEETIQLEKEGRSSLMKTKHIPLRDKMGNISGIGVYLWEHGQAQEAASPKPKR